VIVPRCDPRAYGSVEHYRRVCGGNAGAGTFGIRPFDGDAGTKGTGSAGRNFARRPRDGDAGTKGTGSAGRTMNVIRGRDRRNAANKGTGRRAGRTNKNKNKNKSKLLKPRKPLPGGECLQGFSAPKLVGEAVKLLQTCPPRPNRRSLNGGWSLVHSALRRAGYSCVFSADAALSSSTAIMAKRGKGFRRTGAVVGDLAVWKMQVGIVVGVLPNGHVDIVYRNRENKCRRKSGAFKAKDRPTWGSFVGFWTPSP